MQRIISREKYDPSYGWIVVGALTFVLFGFEGAYGSFGVFLKPIVDELGTSRAVVSGAMSTVVGLAGLVGIIAGRMVDRYGIRMLIAIGAVLSGLAYILLTYQLSHVWQLYLYFGVMVGFSLGLCFVPGIAVVSKWFTEKRVLAVGIASSGLTLGQTVLPLVAAYFIAMSGWRQAFLVLAAMVLLVAIPGVILLGRKPQKTPGFPGGQSNPVPGAGEVEKGMPVQGWSASRASRTLTFRALLVAEFVTASGLFFLLTHIVAYATDLHIADTSAALILTSMNGGSAVGQLVVWAIAARIGSRLAVVMLQALPALVMFLLIQSTSLGILLVLGLAFGFGIGACTTLRLSMVSEFFGTRSAGAILGITGASWSMGGVTGPLLAGFIFDATQSYRMAFLAGGLILTIGAVAATFLKAPAGEVTVRGR